jgi:tetratricopeptide (TPR) repeat protein
LYSKTSSPEKALETLSNMRQEFQNDPEAELRAITLEAELHSKAGNDEQANVCLQQAIDLNTKLSGKTPRDLQLDIAKNCFQQNQQGVAEQIMSDLIKTHIDDDQFLDDVRRMQSGIGMDNHSEELIQRTKRELVATNNQGVKLYKQGKFTEAMALFEKAIASMPENQTIIINTLKIILHDLKAAGMDDEKLVRAQSLLKKARKIGVDRHKLGILQMEFSNLLRQYNEAKL